MNINVNLTDIYARFPKLEDIAMRLEVSENKAKERNKEKKDGLKQLTIKAEGMDQLDYKQRRINAATVEHFKIVSFLRNGKWEETYHPLQPGRQKFEEYLIRILSRDPDALKIHINSSSKESVNSRSEKIEIVLNENAVRPQTDTSEGNEKEESLVFQKIQEQLNGFSEQLKSNSLVDKSNVNETISNLNFAQQLKEIQHANEVANLKRDHKEEVKDIRKEYEKEIEELNDTIEELEDEITELKLELEDTEKSLDGIDEKIEAAQNPPIIDTLGKILSKGIENFAKDNTDGLHRFLGVDEDELKKYFKDKEYKNKEITDRGNSTSFSEASNPVNGVENEVYNGLSEEKRAYADAFIEFTNSTDVADIKVIVTLIQSLIKDNEVNKVLLSKMFELVKQNQPS